MNLLAGVGIIALVVFLIIFWTLIVIFVSRGIKYTRQKKAESKK